MRATLLFVIAILWAGSAVAAECQRGSGDVLHVSGWTAKANETDFFDFLADVSVSLEPSASVRMVDGAVVFTDALGGTIGSGDIDRDLTASPGTTYEQTIHIGRRILDLRKDEVTTVVCVRAVLYEDGTTERFD